MEGLQKQIQHIQPIDVKASEAAQARWNQIAKPLGGLGLLEDALIKIAGITKTPSFQLARKGVVVMCADNGIVAQGVTQTDSHVTEVVAINFTKGKTSACLMAKAIPADMILVDIGIQKDILVEGIIHAKVAYGTKDFSKEPAMTEAECLKAIQVGINLVKDLQKQGYHILGTGEMGIGNTTTSSAVAAALLKLPVETVTGRGAGLNQEGLTRKIGVIKKALIDYNLYEKSPLEILRTVGGLDLAGLVGVYLGGALYRIPIILDGFISTVAALIAVAIAPLTKDYLLASHVSTEPASQAVLKALGLKAFLNCELHLGEGTGAIGALSLLQMAYNVYTKMPTFDEIQIEAYQPLK